MGFEFDFSMVRVPCLMGIVNVTPNSFSDGGEALRPEDAVRRGLEMVEAGARILDVGAEASSFFRPGVEAVEVVEQWRRLAPVLAGLTEPRRHDGTTERFWISVDTRSAEVARRALKAGASIVNDISAGTHDAGMLAEVARLGGAIVLMHMGATYPENPQDNDADIVGTVYEYLSGRVKAALAAGIARERIAVDPGIGFGKTLHDNWVLALCSEWLGDLDVPVVLGVSRKRFLEFGPPAEAELGAKWERLVGGLGGEGMHERDAATAALTRIAADKEVAIHRVHNVGLAARALGM